MLEAKGVKHVENIPFLYFLNWHIFDVFVMSNCPLYLQGFLYDLLIILKQWSFWTNLLYI